MMNYWDLSFGRKLKDCRSGVFGMIVKAPPPFWAPLQLSVITGAATLFYFALFLVLVVWLETEAFLLPKDVALSLFVVVLDAMPFRFCPLVIVELMFRELGVGTLLDVLMLIGECGCL